MTQPRFVRPLLASTFGLLALGMPTWAQCALDTIDISSGPVRLFGSDARRSGKVLLVGANREIDFSSQITPGAAYLYEHNGTSFEIVHTLVPTEPADVGEFGISVALEGTLAVVGHPGDDLLCDGVFFCRNGAVEIYERSANGWDQRQTFRPDDLLPADEFGLDVSIHDGRILVGSRRDDEACPSDIFCDSGSAYVLEKVGLAWVETGKLVPTGGRAGDLFGTSVSLYENRALIGASSDLGLEEGRAFIFEEIGGTWVQTQELIPSVSHARDAYGRSVSLYGDVAIVGAPTADGGGFQRGAAFVFENIGGQFVEVAVLHDIDGGNADLFGSSVSAYDDGVTKKVLVGAPDHDLVQFGDEGAAFLFERSPAGTWDLRREIIGPGATFGDEFGLAVDLRSGEPLIGNPFAGTTNRGAVHLYDFVDSGSLASCATSLSLTSGGTQPLELFGGAANAGELYWILGSITGTGPGFSLGPVVVPLAFDVYTLRTITNPLSGPLNNAIGLLDEHGVANAGFALPSGSDPSLAGLVLHHAFVTVDTPGIAGFASEPLSVELTP